MVLEVDYVCFVFLALDFDEIYEGIAMGAKLKLWCSALRDSLNSNWESNRQFSIALLVFTICNKVKYLSSIYR